MKAIKVSEPNARNLYFSYLFLAIVTVIKRPIDGKKKKKKNLKQPLSDFSSGAQTCRWFGEETELQGSLSQLCHLMKGFSGDEGCGSG